VVHELTPPPGERWEVVDTAHYFSVYARGQETFYAVRRIRDEQAVPSRAAASAPPAAAAPGKAAAPKAPPAASKAATPKGGPKS
jgi:hypothetical protein